MKRGRILRAIQYIIRLRSDQTNSQKCFLYTFLKLQLGLTLSYKSDGNLYDSNNFYVIRFSVIKQRVK